MYKPERLSKGAEKLLELWKGSQKPYDVVIVGSGYGGAVAAARLAGCQDEDGNQLTVCVLERGREHLPRTFPNRFSDLPGHVRYSRFDDPVAKGVRDGLFDLRIGRDVSVLVANGLGGGSLINAGVAEEPEWDVFDADWPKDIRDDWGRKTSKDRSEHFQRAREMLMPVRATVDGLDKHKQFIEFVERSGPKVEKADIYRDKITRIAVKDNCIKCGDCATGCNVGARRTLATNYLEEARQYEAEIYTGATVSHVEKRGAEWAVFLGLTTEAHPIEKKPLREIRAKHVILAAGTLGSTEILMRSKARSRDLLLSNCLGERFSSNGDMISAIYGQRSRVNAAPSESKAFSERNVGPTITGIASFGKTRDDRIVVEELAIPGALRRIFEEVVTTSAMLESLGRRDRSEHRLPGECDPAAVEGKTPDGRPVDPAAVDPALIENTQIFAAMGNDGAGGSLEMVPGWNEPAHLDRVNDGAIRINWPEAGEHPIYKRQDEVLSSRVQEGEIYLRNPLWRPLPKGISDELSGAKPTGLLFSMHPLGGCRMADDAEHGVVDQIGRVFSGTTGSEVHEGLLVLDGSIVPAALGINPLLTITALAERAIELYCICRRWEKKKRSDLPELPQVQIERRKTSRGDTQEDKEQGKARERATEAATKLRLSERMTGELTLVPGAAAVEAELTLHFEPVALHTEPGSGPHDFLRDPLHRLNVTGGVLRVRERGEHGEPGPWHATEVLRGRVDLLVRGESKPLERILGALSAWSSTRAPADVAERFGSAAGGLAAGLSALFRNVRSKSLLALLDSFPATRRYADLASRVGEVRYLFYKVTLAHALKDASGKEVPGCKEIRGRKTLKYIAGANPWRQLTELELTAHPEGGRIHSLGTLSVDPAYFFHGFASRLQITAQRDLPAAWMDFASLALFVARILLKIHFWSFRLPEYQKYDPERDLRRLPGRLGKLLMERHVVGYPETPRDAGIFLPITRYRASETCPSGPVVLFHGLGSGGIQFATSKVKPNMVQHLAAEGFDVWVAELRTSIALPSSLAQWTLDKVARDDIPRIIDFVLDKTRKDQTAVVAHCIGSAMFCTAVLDGRLQHESGKSKVRSAVLLQVGPLITLSKGTRLRGLVTAPLQRFLPEGHLDFSVDDRAGWVEALIDRVLATYPYPAEETTHHRLRWFGKHNRHIANCNRWAAIDGRMFEHDNLGPQMLDALGEVLGHSSISTWAQTVQYAFLERLTDSEAKNSYVTAENVRAYFNFPVRFFHGEKNDVFHPLTSWRSHELLKAVHGAAFDSDVRILPGFGHFDPLIGKYAETHVFQFISGFLAKAPAAQAGVAPQQPTAYYFRRPLIGPLLGWVRRNDEGAWCARVWCRIDDLRSSAKWVLVQVFKDKTGLQSELVRCPTDQMPGGRIKSLVVGPIDTTLCIDMELGKDPGTYEIVVLSIHESLEASVSEELRRAELSAGKRNSARRPHLPIKAGGPTLEQRIKNPTLVRRLRLVAAGRAGDAGREDKIDCAKVRIPADAESSTLTFALASCRYPGWIFDREQADATFGRIKESLKRVDTAPSALLLVGDQIYADATAGAFDPKDRRERFYEAYREAWTAPNAREVLSHIPVYMMMDDHEAGDNWHPKDFLGKEDKEMRADGLEAVRQYQWIHSPGNLGQPMAPAGEPEIYYYQFKLQGFPVFVCDTRSTRSKQGILDARQFEVLTRWLKDAQRAFKDRPKLVVSPSVLVPFLKGTDVRAYAGRSDGWDGYRRQLIALFSFIRREGIENTLFLCGDSHISMSSEIWFEPQGREAGPRAFCVVASPMYAPYPFANGRREQFVERDVMPLDGAGTTEMHYEVLHDSWVPKSSFSLLNIRQQQPDGWTIDVSVRGVEGNLASIRMPTACAVPRTDPQKEQRTGKAPGMPREE